MRLSVFFTLATLFLLAPSSHAVHADVGQCWVMFVFTPDFPLGAEQQKELGKRLMDAHVGSSQSDGHFMFLCHIGYKENGVLYEIHETYAKVGHHVTGYRLTAPDFDGLRLAVREVEQASEQNRIYGLKAGARKKIQSAPLYKTEDRSTTR